MPDFSDPLTLARIVVKALAYGASLLAAGLALFLAAHSVDPETTRFTRRLSLPAALAGVALAGAAVLGEALYLVGGDWAGALDPFLLGLVIDSPIGSAQGARAFGLGLIILSALDRRFGAVAVLGALAVVASFALVGHSVREPRAALATLVAVHVGAAAYWIGAFAPLARLARCAPPQEAGRVTEAFGRGAVWAVGVLAVAGAALGLTFGGDPVAALGSAWGLTLAFKLALVSGLLVLAALNKLRLSPRLAAGEPGAAAALQRSIGLEAAVAAAILVLTAVMTSTGAPAA